MGANQADDQKPPLVLVAARMSSRRLPGKVLMKFGREPLLGHVVSAASHARNTSGVVVVTSAHSSDDPISDWCNEEGIPHWRGSLEDVASRMLEATKHYEANAFVRISGDSPMLDPEIVTAASEIFIRGSHDLVSNVEPRAFPPGESVEIIRATTLERFMQGSDVTTYDREHVTSVLYRHADELSIGRVEPEGAWQTEPALTIDTRDDAERFHRIIQLLDGEPAWPEGWKRCAELCERATLEITVNETLKHA